jgi:hypothetical protein
MSAQPKEKEKEQNFYSDPGKDNPSHSSRVDVNDLVARMNESKKQERKSNIILSAAAISAVTVFGIILTL